MLQQLHPLLLITLAAPLVTRMRLEKLSTTLSRLAALCSQHAPCHSFLCRHSPPLALGKSCKMIFLASPAGCIGQRENPDTFLDKSEAINFIKLGWKLCLAVFACTWQKSATGVSVCKTNYEHVLNRLLKLIELYCISRISCAQSPWVNLWFHWRRIFLWNR